MSIRNLDAIFRPKAIALIGASDRPQSVGCVTAGNLLSGGFEGPVFLVNPRHETIGATRCYPDIESLPVVPDLAVICTPAATVPDLTRTLGARGVRGAIVITAGFRELGTEKGKALERAMLETARPTFMRIIGPNCVGVISTPAGLNASFAPSNANKGGVAFIAQSGAMLTTILDWAAVRGLGFSHLVSLGDMTDVDFGDMLDYLANDPSTTAVLLYIEAITAPRKFMSAARAASRLKPVIAIKAGRHAAAARAAQSHTGALAGVDAVYDAAFRRAGILRVRDLEELFDAVETLRATPMVSGGDGLTILTNGGGAGVLATDTLLDLGGTLTELTPQTIAKLDAVLPPTWSHANPVDIVGDAPAARYAATLDTLLDAPEVSSILVMNCPTAIASGTEAAGAVINKASAKRRPLLTNWLGAKSADAARQMFTDARIPTFATPKEAITGFMHLTRFRRGQDIIMEVPASSSVEATPTHKTARTVVDAAISAGKVWLDADEVRQLLDGYGIPMPRTRIAASSEEAAVAAGEIGFPVALKLLSPDITHKSDVGGVALNLETRETVRTAGEAMRERVAKAMPSARLEGFVVQELIRRLEAYELIIGMAVDRQFGPFILFGQGGVAVEVIADKALALPPLNTALARELMSQTRIYRQLEGYRDRASVALDEIALTLVKVSQLVCDLDGVVELDINPLLADARGVIALDARVRVASPGAGTAQGRLAIRPYPSEYERKETITGLEEMLLRPIRPEDAAALQHLVSSLTPEDARLRFFTPLRSLDPRALARFTQIDYDREMALALFIENAAGVSELAGVVRLAADPDNREAEFAILVRSDLHRRGVGRRLMTRIIDYARARETREIIGHVLRENVAMLALCRQLGFGFTPVTGAGGLVRVSLALTTS